MAAARRVFTSTKVILPENDHPVPATIVVDSLTGKIIDVKHGHAHRAQFPDTEWVDAADNYILPGLVECVLPYKLPYGSVMILIYLCSRFPPAPPCTRLG